MDERVLGKSNIKVSEIGLGCMGMTHAYGKQRDKKDMIKLIHKAIDLGCTFFDSAVVYGEDNERYLGEALKEYRDDVVIATKFGITGQKSVDGKPVNVLDSRPETIRKQLDESLERLQTDHIDLYYQHRVDPNVDAEVVANVMNELIDEGKINAWGLSNAPTEYLYRANDVCPIAAVENQYSMVYNEPEKEVFDICDKLNIAFVAYSPLGNGFLSGAYTPSYKYEEGDFRSTMARFSKKAMQTNQALLDLIKEIAQSKECTPAQLVLAWELAQKPFIIPIPGTTKISRLEENLSASNVKITKTELDEINNEISKLEIDYSHF